MQIHLPCPTLQSWSSKARGFSCPPWFLESSPGSGTHLYRRQGAGAWSRVPSPRTPHRPGSHCKPGGPQSHPARRTRAEKLLGRSTQDLTQGICSLRGSFQFPSPPVPRRPGLQSLLPQSYSTALRCARPSGVPRGPATSTGSLASQRHPGKFPKVPGRRRGIPRVVPSSTGLPSKRCP